MRFADIQLAFECVLLGEKLDVDLISADSAIIVPKGKAIGTRALRKVVSFVWLNRLPEDIKMRILRVLSGIVMT